MCLHLLSQLTLIFRVVSVNDNHRRCQVLYDSVNHERETLVMIVTVKHYISFKNSHGHSIHKTIQELIQDCCREEDLCI